MDWMGTAEGFRYNCSNVSNPREMAHFKIKSPEFGGMFNYHLAKMRKSGVLAKTELKWLSPDRPQPPQDLNQVADALGGNQVFFPFSILLAGIAGSVAFVAFEKIKLFCQHLLSKDRKRWLET